MNRSKLRFRLRAACRIAQIDSDRFNEAVAANNYPCAPSTSPGSARTFGEDDLVALYVYGRLILLGVTPNLAGRLACMALEKLQREPKATTISYVDSHSNLKKMEADFDKPKRRTTLTHGNRIVSRIEWDVENIRAIIRAEMDDEALVVGEEN